MYPTHKKIPKKWFSSFLTDAHNNNPLTLINSDSFFWALFHSSFFIHKSKKYPHLFQQCTWRRWNKQKLNKNKTDYYMWRYFIYTLSLSQASVKEKKAHIPFNASSLASRCVYITQLRRLLLEGIGSKR